MNSLESVNIDPKKNDIKFIEDDGKVQLWVLRTWMGSSVQWDGNKSIYIFSTNRRVECKPVSLELTYGLERLAMFVQDIDNVFEIIWDNNGTKYGEVFKKQGRESHIIIFVCL